MKATVRIQIEALVATLRTALYVRKDKAEASQGAERNRERDDDR